MKIAFILFNNPERSPYLFYYSKIANSCNVNYEIIFWDRSGKVKENDKFVFKEKVQNSKNKIPKILSFFHYANFVKKILDEEKFDKVVLFTSQLTLLVCSYLIRNRIPYVIDIRDYSCEKIPGVSILLKRYISKSSFTVISAPDFKNFLPNADYYLCHNIGANNELRQCCVAQKNVPIRIAYVGGIGYFNEVSAFLISIKNDSRFIFEFYGTGEIEGKLKEFCKENSIRNCLFHGEYHPSEKDNILSKINILYNCYGNSDNVVKYALSNKLYDAFKFGLPILVSPSTSMENTADFLGISINTDDLGSGDKIYNWYHSINWGTLWKKAHIKYQGFLEENKKFEQKFANFLV